LRLCGRVDRPIGATVVEWCSGGCVFALFSCSRYLILTFEMVGRVFYLI